MNLSVGQGVGTNREILWSTQRGSAGKFITLLRLLGNHEATKKPRQLWADLDL
jgi:hypothetical protein